MQENLDHAHFLHGICRKQKQPAFCLEGAN